MADILPMRAFTPSSNLRPQRVRTAVGTVLPAVTGGDFFASFFRVVSIRKNFAPQPLVNASQQS